MRASLFVSAFPLLLTATAAGAQAPPTPPAPPTPVAAPAPPAAPTAATAPTPPSPPAVTAAEVDRDAVLGLGRFVSTWANIGSVDSLITRADPGLGTPEVMRERLTGGLASFAEQLGTETKVVEEKVMIVNGQVQYWRTAEYTGVPVALVFRVMVGRNGRWRGFTVTPNEQLPQGGEEVKQP